MIVKVAGFPLHKLPRGVTVIVAVIAEVPGLEAINGTIFPVPLAGNPIDVLLFVQVYEVALPLNVIAEVDEPLHTVWFGTAVTIGNALTVSGVVAVVEPHSFVTVRETV